MRNNETYNKLFELLKNPRITAEDLAKVIAEDKALAGSLIHFVWSFGFPPAQCTIVGAINLLGFDAMKTIVNELPHR